MYSECILTEQEDAQTIPEALLTDAQAADHLNFLEFPQLMC
jgi:hypothetical protein